MFTILIADDEDIIRAGLISMIEDLNLPISKIIEAENGLKALELVKLHQPDIIILDIKMPKMGGLQFMQELRDSGNISKAIILSGFSDFEYARKAINLKISDYLLKPILDDKLEAALKKVIFEIQDNIEKENLIFEQSEELNNVLSTLTEKKIKEYILGINDDNISIIDYLHNKGFVFTKPGFILCAGEVFWQNELCKQWLNILKTEVSVLIKNCIFVPFSSSNVVLIINTSLEDCSHESFTNLFQLINQNLKPYSFCLTWGISNYSSNSESFPKLLRQSQSAIKEKILYCTGNVYIMDEISSHSVSLLFTNEDITKINICLETGDEKRLMEITSQIIEFHVKYHNISVKSLEEGFFKFCIQRLLELDGIKKSNEILDPALDTFLQKVEKCTSKSDLVELFSKTLFSIFNDAKKRLDLSNGNKTITFAKEFIDNNYNKDITLDMVSNYVSLNPSYFSSFFKKETGLTMRQYLTDVRINKALELLKDPINKIYNISIATGFEDEKYFCKVFKKKLGITPSEYRENSFLPKKPKQ